MDTKRVTINTNTYIIRHTWFDRDLGIAGRVMVQQHDGTYRHTLVHIKK